MAAYLKELLDGMDQATRDSTLNCPLPLVIFRPETDEVPHLRHRQHPVPHGEAHLHAAEAEAVHPPGVPLVGGAGILRSPFRPNPIGLSCVKLEGVDLSTPDGPVLFVSGADLTSTPPKPKPYTRRGSRW